MFDLLHQDHLLYEEHTVGDVLREGDHVNTVSRFIPDPPSSTGSVAHEITKLMILSCPTV